MRRVLVWVLALAVVSLGLTAPTLLAPRGISTAGSVAGNALISTGSTALWGTPNVAANNITSGTVPTARLGSGTATASTCLLGNSTWGACGSGGLDTAASYTWTGQHIFNTSQTRFNGNVRINRPTGDANPAYGFIGGINGASTGSLLYYFDTNEWRFNSTPTVNGTAVVLNTDSRLTTPAAHTHAAGDLVSGTVAPDRLGSGTADSTTFLRGDSTWATVSAQPSQVDVYGGPGTVSGTDFGTFTWTKPSWATTVTVTVVGAGGGGGSGRKGAAGAARSGGGGGGGGGVSTATFAADALPATVTVTVGNGGTGAAAVTANSTNGNTGGLSGATSFGTYLRAMAVVGGNGGATAAVTAAGGGGAIYGGSAGGVTSVTAAASQASATVAGAGGGGGGGSISSGNAVFAGGAGAVGGTAMSNAGNGTAGSSGSRNGVAGTIQAAPAPFGSGGGGGGFPSDTTVAAGTGGAGGWPGGGGGGGGAALDTTTPSSGGGGRGGNGVVVVYSTP
ncbi:glycine-rich domain-containing protein [Deinococcus rufus]|uniref:Glycine-rich domain-containing protein n=1 Tax=Deinococcus rufus TaxID=2136097 RepID=A0ABV7Z904_9DEIO